MKWLKIPWLVPGAWKSWVPLPSIVISRCERQATSRHHQLHEMAHILQIRRTGYVRHALDYQKQRKLPHSERPIENEARAFADTAIQDGEWHPLLKYYHGDGWL